MSMFVCRCAGALLVGLFVGGPMRAADWNQWRGPQRNGLSPDSPRLIDALPDGGLRPVWITTEPIPASGGGGWSSPIVADGRVYLYAHTRTGRRDVKLPPERFPQLSQEQRAALEKDALDAYERNRQVEQRQRHRQQNLYEDTVYCLDAATGRTLWTRAQECVPTQYSQSSSPAVFDGRLYVLGAGRLVRCLDARTGQPLWTQRLRGDYVDEIYQGSVALAEGLLIVAADAMFGLDRSTGNVLWQADKSLAPFEHSSPAVWDSADGQRVVLNIQGNATACVDPTSGKELWRVASFAGRATPVVAAERLVTLGNSRKGGLRCYELSPGGPRELWAYQRVSDEGASPVVVGGHVYVRSDRDLACVDLATGKPDWTGKLESERPRYTSLAAADGKLIGAYEGVFLLAADPGGYRPLASGRIGEDGLLAEESYFRKLYKIDQVEQEENGRQKAEQLLRGKLGRNRPYQCASPAIVDGRLYLRLGRGLACYDLRSP